MNPDMRKIDRLFSSMDERKKSLMSLVNSLPVEKYFLQPDAKAWSVAQVVNHLYLSEKLSLSYLRKKLSYPESVPRYHVKSWLGMWLYKIIMKIRKAKAPEKIDMWQDQEILMPRELSERWDHLRLEFREYINEVYPKFSSHLVYKHPFAGRITIRQMLTFFDAHIAHHALQVEKILKKTGPL